MAAGFAGAPGAATASTPRATGQTAAAQARGAGAHAGPDGHADVDRGAGQLDLHGHRHGAVERRDEAELVGHGLGVVDMQGQLGIATANA